MEVLFLLAFVYLTLASLFVLIILHVHLYRKFLAKHLDKYVYGEDP
jgi:hypothetical protein